MKVLEAMKSLQATPTQMKLEKTANGASVGAVAAQAGSMAKPGASKISDFTDLSKIGMPKPITQKTAMAKNGNTDLLIFVSMSMPEQMLMNYAAQAKRFDAVLILRGFIGDKSSTTREVLAKLNKAGANWEISPEPFKTFKIDKVPAIVLASAESTSVVENGCAQPETYSAIFGDLGVLDALDKFSLLSKTPLSKAAKDRILADRAAAKRG